MGGLIPLTDASRRPVRIPVITALIIVVNAIVFGLELVHGEPFVMQWSVIPAQISSGHQWITILTAMFMHGSWSHIIGNMVFLWAFGPEVEDAMGRGRYLIFYLVGGLVAMLAQVVADPHSTVPNLGASGAIAAVMGAFLVMYPRDQIKINSGHLHLCEGHVYPGLPFDRLLVSEPGDQCGTGGTGAERRSGLLGTYRRLYLRSRHCTVVHSSRGIVSGWRLE